MSTGKINSKIILTAGFVVPIILVFISLFIGRYPLAASQLLAILKAAITGDHTGFSLMEQTLVWQIRMPRILMALLVGAALAVSGGALQGVFRNPLVDSGMLGVSAGAGFGACLSIILFNSMVLNYVFAFVFGLIAVGLSYSVGKIYKAAPTIMLVLGGVIISSIFSALISFAKYIADPYQELSEITFWLMGSLARANYRDLLVASIPIVIGMAGIMLVRWRINVLSLGETEARSMGVNTALYRGIIITCTALATAGSVCISGTIGWIGLVIPHIGRMLVGNDNRKLIPLCITMGGCFLLIVDDIARSITGSEIPLGILTALIGGPIYIIILKNKRGVGDW